MKVDSLTILSALLCRGHFRLLEYQIIKMLKKINKF